MTALCLWLVLSTASAQDGHQIPDLSFTPDQLYSKLGPDMESEALNQPSVVDGLLMLSGNAHHSLWDISNPFQPVRLSRFDSPHDDGEAESHQVAFRVTVQGRPQAALINGLGVDLWDLSDASAPELLSTVALEGVRYGDNTEAVWGVAWQGRWLYVGGTNTGLHVVDTLDPTAPEVVTRMRTSELGGVSAGPLWTMGNTLVITTPKDLSGVATVDISDPALPALLDFVLPGDDSYIGGFYGGNAVLVDPLRTYDVLTDPGDITLLGTFEHPASEYLSFADGHLFLGSMRPHPGARKYRVLPAGQFALEHYIEGRRDDVLQGFFTDDQFQVPIGNLLVLADDEVRRGAWITAHDTRPDREPPRLMAVSPADGASRQATTTRIGLSLSDQIDSRSLTPDALTLRPLGGEPVVGSWGLTQTVVNFAPDAPLMPDTTYELTVHAGGIRDLVGNGLPETTTTVFSTGDDVVGVVCGIDDLQPVPVGEPITVGAVAVPGARYTWDQGNGEDTVGTSPQATLTWSKPGRYPLTLTVEAEGARRSCSRTVVVEMPTAEVAPRSSSTVAVDEARGLAWVVVPDAGGVAAVDWTEGTLVHEVAACAEPRQVALTADGTAWVTCHGADRLVAIDPDAGTVARTVDLRWGAHPYGIVITPDDATAFVTLEEAGSVAEIDLAAGTVGSERTLGGRLRGLTLAPDGALLAPAFVSDAEGGRLHVIRGEEVDTLALAIDPGPDDNDAGRGVPNYVAAAAVSPDGGLVALPSKKDNLQRGLARDGQALDSDNTVRAIVSWVDLELGVEDLSARIDFDDHEGPNAAVFSPAGDLLFVSSRGSNQVDVADVRTGSRVSGVSTGLTPDGLALTDDGTLLVHDSLGRTISVFDAASLLSGDDTTMPLRRQVSTVSAEPLEATLLLGKQLYHVADSRQMSQDGYIACATCHLDGLDDGMVWDFTDRGEGLRNTIDLRGRAGVGHGPMHWSGNFDEVQDFEHDIRGSFGGAGLMADEDFFAEGRDETLGARKAGYSDRLDALSAYVSTFDTFPRSPWRATDGNLTEEAAKGRRIFESRDCLSCHSGPALTDSAEGVRHDVGTLAPTSGDRLGGILDGLDTPTLFGLWNTAPYFHDGSAPTLTAVLEREGHGNAQDLSDTRKAQLVAFLMQLEEDQLPLEARPCGCDSRGGGLPWLAALVGLLAGRRRRD